MCWLQVLGPTRQHVDMLHRGVRTLLSQCPGVSWLPLSCLLYEKIAEFSVTCSRHLSFVLAVEHLNPSVLGAVPALYLFMKGKDRSPAQCELQRPETQIQSLSCS